MTTEHPLLDALLSHRLPGGPPLSEWLNAKKFVLDDKASLFVGDLLRRDTRAIMREHEFARVPFPVTWIELDHRAFYKGLGVPYKNIIDERISDLRLGFLFHHNSVWQAFSAPGERGSMLPVVFHLHRPVSVEDEIKVAALGGMTRDLWRQALMGYVNVPPDWWHSPEVENVCRSHTTEFLGSDKFHDPTRRWLWDSLTVQTAGTLKLVLTLALLLTKPGEEVLNMVSVPHRRAIVRGKAMTLKAYTNITLHLKHRDPVVHFLKKLKATGRRLRKHDVRGHWAQHRGPGTFGCQHHWDALTVDKYVCLSCQAKRWWVRYHFRGSDPEVQTEYEVTT